MKTTAAAVALLCLLACLVMPILVFYGALGRETFEILFILASVGWFAAATLWASRAARAAEDLRSS